MAVTIYHKDFSNNKIQPINLEDSQSFQTHIKIGNLNMENVY